MRPPKLMFAHNLSRSLPHAPLSFYHHARSCPLYRSCRPATSTALETLPTTGHRHPIARPALAHRRPTLLPLRPRPTLPLWLLPRNRTPSRRRQPPRLATPATGTARRPVRLWLPNPATATLGHRHRSPLLPLLWRPSHARHRRRTKETRQHAPLRLCHGGRDPSPPPLHRR